MAHDRYYPSLLTVVHPTKNPQACIFLVTGASALAAVVLLLTRNSVMDISAWAGTIATYALIFPYVVVSAAAPFALKREGCLSTHSIIASILSVVAMSGVFFGSFLPIPAAPYCWFPLLFCAYMIAGAFWYKRVAYVLSRQEAKISRLK